MRYLALLRGINVGGKAIVGMTKLKAALETSGFANVKTFIQSGNVFFDHPNVDQVALAEQIEAIILKRFKVATKAVVFSQKQWQAIIAGAPDWWGKDDTWKHNLLVLLPPYDMPTVIAAVGQLKPDIEAMAPGPGVLYQSMSKALFGRTTTGKLANSPIYQRMTVRNYNTTQKLLELF